MCAPLPSGIMVGCGTDMIKASQHQLAQINVTPGYLLLVDHFQVAEARIPVLLFAS